MPGNSSGPELPKGLPEPIQDYIHRRELTPELAEQLRQDFLKGHWIFKGPAYDSDGNKVELPSMLSVVVSIHDIELQVTEEGNRLCLMLEAGRYGTVYAYLDDTGIGIEPL